MRKFFISIAVVLSLGAHAQARWNQVYQQYIDQYKDIAIEQMQRHRIPASITLAQGLFESGAGRSELAVKGNNHFGIKCNGWFGRKVYHDDDERNECFRAYNSAFESYEDHSRFLTGSKRYSALFNLKMTDYKGWAKGLQALSVRYAEELRQVHGGALERSARGRPGAAQHQDLQQELLRHCATWRHLQVAGRGDWHQL